MSVTTVKPNQYARAKEKGVEVYDKYTGSDRKLLYVSSKEGESLGETTGLTFDRKYSVSVEGGKQNESSTSVTTLAEIVYLEKSVSIFGFPSFNRKLAYVVLDDVTFEEAPKPSTSTGSTTGTTGKTPDVTAPDVATPVGSTPSTVVPKANDKVVEKSSGLPAWAKYVLIGLAFVATLLGGIAISRASKKGGKK